MMKKIQNGEKSDGKNLSEFCHSEKNNHYVWIKDLSKLLSKQISKHDGKKFICIRCFNYFRLESAFKKHEEICKNIDFIKTIIPKKEHLLNLKIIRK